MDCKKCCQLNQFRQWLDHQSKGCRLSRCIQYDYFAHQCEHMMDHGNLQEAKNILNQLSCIIITNECLSHFGLLQAKVFAATNSNEDDVINVTEQALNGFSNVVFSEENMKENLIFNFFVVIWNTCVRYNIHSIWLLNHFYQEITFTDKDGNWKVLIALQLVKSYLETGQRDKVPDLWAEILSNIEEMSPSLYIIKELIKLQKKMEDLALNVNPLPENKFVDYMKQIMDLKSDDENFKETVTALMKNVCEGLTVGEKCEALEELFFFAEMIANKDISLECLLAISKMGDVQYINKCNALKLIFKSKYLQNNILSADKSQCRELANRARHHLKNVIASNCCFNDVQQACIIFWNLYLIMLNQDTRNRLHPYLLMIGSACQEAKCNISLLVSQLELELALCEANNGNYLAMEKHAEKAIAYDKDGKNTELLTILSNFCVLKKTETLIRPLNKYEFILHYLVTMLTQPSIDPKTCKAVLYRVAQAITDDLFAEVLATEQNSKDFHAQQQWALEYASKDNDILFLNETLNQEEQNLAIWFIIIMVASSHLLWDYVRASSRFFSMLKAVMSLNDSKSTSSFVFSETGEGQSMRIVMIVFYLQTKALMKFLEENVITKHSLASTTQQQTTQQQTTQQEFVNTIQSIERVVASRILYVMSAAEKLGEQWLIISLAKRLWNYAGVKYFDKQATHKDDNLSGCFIKTLQLLQSLDDELIDVILLTQYTHVVTSGMAPQLLKRIKSEFISANIDLKKSVIKSVSSKHKELSLIMAMDLQAIDILENTLLKITSPRVSVNVDSWPCIHNVIRNWVVLKGTKVEEVERFTKFLNSDDQQRSQLLFYLELMMKLGTPELDNSEISLPVIVRMFCELDWDTNLVFQSFLLSNITELALLQNNRNMLEHCTLIANDIEMRLRRDFFCKVVQRQSFSHLAIVYALAAESVTEERSASISIKTLRLFNKAAFCALAGNNKEEQFGETLKKFWNVTYPLTLRKGTRIHMEMELSLMMKYLSVYFKKCKKTVSGKGFNVDLIEDQLLTISFLLATFAQIMTDKGEYQKGVDQLASLLPLIAAGHKLEMMKPIEDAKVYLEIQEKPSVLTLSFMENCFQSNAHWLNIVRNGQAEKPLLFTLCKSVLITQKFILTLPTTFQILNLLEYLNHSSNNREGVEEILCMLHEFLNFSSHNEKNDQPLAKINKLIGMLFTCCFMANFYYRGSEQQHIYALKAATLLMDLWKELFEFIDAYDSYCLLLEHPDEWSDVEKLSQMFKDKFSFLQLGLNAQMCFALYRCLQNLADKVKWLGHHQLQLPIYSLCKVLTFLPELTQCSILTDLQILNLCLKLELLPRASVLHQAITSTPENKLLFQETLNSLANMKETVSKLHKELDFESCNCYEVNMNEMFAEANLKFQLNINDILVIKLREIDTLMIMGYFEIVERLLNEIDKFNKEYESPKLCMSVNIRKAQLAVFNGICVDMSLIMLASLESEKIDYFKLINIIVNSLVMTKDVFKWKIKAEKILDEGIKIYQHLQLKYPSLYDHYKELSVCLRIRKAEVYCMQTYSTDLTFIELNSSVQEFINLGNQCFENNWLRHGICAVTLLLGILVENSRMKGIGYQCSLTDQALKVVKTHLKTISINLNTRPTDVLTVEMKLPIEKETSTLLVYYAKLLLIKATYCLEEEKLVATDVTLMSKSFHDVQVYLELLKPWKCDEHEMDVSAILGEISEIMNTFVAHGKHKELEIMALNIMGSVKLLEAEHEDYQKCIKPTDDKSFSEHVVETDEHLSVSVTSVAHAEEEEQPESEVSVTKDLRVEASQLFSSALEESITNKMFKMASDSAEGLIECFIKSDLRKAFLHLILYQTFTVNVMMKKLLHKISDKPSSKLDFFIKCLNYLEEHSLEHSPLYDMLNESMKANAQIWKVLHVSATVEEIETYLESQSTTIIVIFQHNAKCNILYAGVYINAEIKVIKVEKVPGDIEDLYKELQFLQNQSLFLKKIWPGLHNENLTDFRDQLETHCQLFEELLKKLDDYLQPVFCEFLTVDSFQNSLDESFCVLLLLDKWLQLLPVELLPFFKRLGKRTLVRDFSLLHYKNREYLLKNDKPSSLGAKAKPDKTQGKQAVKKNSTVNNVSISKLKVFYIIQEMHKLDCQVSQLEELLTSLNLGSEKNMKVGNIDTLRDESLLLNNNFWKDSQGWFIWSSRKSVMDLIKKQFESTKMIDPKLVTVFDFEENIKSFERDLFPNSVDIALLLTMVGFGSIVICQWPDQPVERTKCAEMAIKEFALGKPVSEIMIGKFMNAFSMDYDIDANMECIQDFLHMLKFPLCCFGLVNVSVN